MKVICEKIKDCTYYRIGIKEPCIYCLYNTNTSIQMSDNNYFSVWQFGDIIEKLRKETNK